MIRSNLILTISDAFVSMILLHFSSHCSRSYVDIDLVCKLLSRQVFVLKISSLEQLLASIDIFASYFLLLIACFFASRVVIDATRRVPMI